MRYILVYNGRELRYDSLSECFSAINNASIVGAEVECEIWDAIRVNHPRFVCAFNSDGLGNVSQMVAMGAGSLPLSDPLAAYASSR